MCSHPLLARRPARRLALAALLFGGVFVACGSGGGASVRIEPLKRDGGAAAATRGAAAAAAQPYQLVATTDAGVERVIHTALADRESHYSVVVKELTHGSGATLNADRVFYSASLFKLAVMYEAYRQAETGDLRMSTQLTVTKEALAEDEGTLAKVQIKEGDKISIGRLVELMIIFSDNTSSVLLRDVLGRPRIDQTMRSLGMSVTSVTTPELPTTATDMAILMDAIATGRGVSKAASKKMTEMLSQQSVRGRIPAGVPASVTVANKTGTWENAGHDVAIVYAPTGPYLLTVLSDLTVRDDIIADLSRRVYAYYTDRSR